MHPNARLPALPPEVTALVGETPRRLVGYGAATAFAGQGMVAKVGPPAVLAREARILGGEMGCLPLEVPERIAAGPGWLVMREVPNHGGAWDEPGFAALLGDLARLHDTFESSPALAGGWLRDPAGADLAATLAEGGDQTGIELPDALAQVRANPEPVARLIARSGPLTLVHGDPTPANVLRLGGRRVWIDWEWASAAPAAVDLACWLGEGPWQFARRLDRDASLTTYLAARERPVDRPAFERALDAALVLFLFANNLPSLARAAGREALQAMIVERVEALARIG